MVLENIIERSRHSPFLRRKQKNKVKEQNQDIIVREKRIHTVYKIDMKRALFLSLPLSLSVSLSSLSLSFSLFLSLALSDLTPFSPFSSLYKSSPTFFSKVTKP